MLVQYIPIFDSTLFVSWHWVWSSRNAMSTVKSAATSILLPWQHQFNMPVWGWTCHQWTCWTLHDCAWAASNRIRQMLSFMFAQTISNLWLTSWTRTLLSLLRAVSEGFSSFPNSKGSIHQAIWIHEEIPHHFGFVLISMCVYCLLNSFRADGLLSFSQIYNYIIPIDSNQPRAFGPKHWQQPRP